MLGSRCMRCEAPRKLRAVISDRNGRPHPQLLALEEFLLRDPARSEAVVKWATRGSMARTIRQMATGERPVSLRTIAEEPATAGSGYVAALLMEAGVLPIANFERVRLEVWQETFLASIPDPVHRRLVRRYAQWAVNPLFAETAHLAVSDQGHRFSRSRQHLKAVRDLLEAAAAVGCGLDTLPQQAFDEYVVTHGAAGRELTAFIRWARRNRLTALRSHYAQAHYAVPVVSDDERWDWVRQLLAAEDVMLSSRVGGLLSITFGIPVTRVLILRRDAVHDHGDQVQLNLSKDPVTLPQPIGDLLRRLLQEPAISPVREDIWVFRGRRPGHHLSPAALTKPLLARGIRVGHARSAALLTLARDAPPSVLADLLGISISSAERWGKLAAHDWIDYPLLRDLSAEQSGRSETVSRLKSQPR